MTYRIDRTVIAGRNVANLRASDGTCLWTLPTLTSALLALREYARDGVPTYIESVAITF